MFTIKLFYMCPCLISLYLHVSNLDSYTIYGIVAFHKTVIFILDVMCKMHVTIIPENATKTKSPGIKDSLQYIYLFLTLQTMIATSMARITIPRPKAIIALCVPLIAVIHKLCQYIHVSLETVKK